MDNALALLMWLRIRGRARRIWKSAKTTRGKVFFAIGMVMVGLWVMGFIVGQFIGQGSEKTASPDSVALVMFAVTVFTCLASGAKELSFTPAEMDFLFPGPFTRKRLLLYRLSTTALGSLITALFFACWQGQHAASFLAAFIALYGLFIFGTLASIIVTLVRKALSDPGSAQAIRVGAWALVLGCIAGIIDMLRAVMSAGNPLSLQAWHQAQNTISGRVILAPFQVLTCVFLAPQVWPNLLLWAGIALGMILLLLLFVLRLDAYFLESSLEVSLRMAAKLARAKRGSTFTRTRSGSVQGSLPMLPRLGGVGVIGWRQLTNAMRNFRGLLIFLFIMLVFSAPALWRIAKTGASAGDHVNAAGIVGFAVPWLLFFLPMMLRFDFRSDIEQMDVLKSLPLSPLAICTGQIIAPSLCLTLVIAVLMSILAFVSPATQPILLLAFPYVPVAAALMFAIENMMFLLAPFRGSSVPHGDIQSMGRSVVVILIKFGILILTGGAAAALGGVTYLLVHSVASVMSVEKSVALVPMFIVVWITLLAAIYIVLRIAARLFARYDPSMHAPA